MLAAKARGGLPTHGRARVVARFHNDPRAFRSGALDIVSNPVNGWLNSNIRKIAHAADSANSDRLVNTVTFKGENRLKLANMITSQNARIARNGAGTRLSDSTNSKRRVCARSLLSCAARDCSARCKSSCGEQFLDCQVNLFRLGVGFKQPAYAGLLPVPEPVGKWTDRAAHLFTDGPSFRAILRET